jgi:tetratricopeptide (TPR) repeat protein
LCLRQRENHIFSRKSLQVVKKGMVIFMRIQSKLITIVVVASITFQGCGLSSGNRYYSKALGAYEEKEYQTAKEYFIKATKANEDKAEYHIDYGFTLLYLNEFTSAREQFEYVILDKDIAMVRENNKKAYRGIGISHLMENQYDLAITNFDKAIEIKEADELDVDLLLYKASALELKGELDIAAEIYTTLLVQRKDDVTIYNARANIYRLIGNYELSITDYDKAIELSPQDFNLYFGKFASLKELNKEEEAKAVLEQAAQLEISSDQDKYELAKVHFYQGNVEMAINEFTALIEKGYTEGYYFIGEMHLQNKKYEDALTQFNSYIKAGNKVFGLLYNQMLTCYLQTSNLAEAKICLDKAKKIADVTIQDQLLKNEIIYLEKMGDFNEAYSCMTTYLDKYPGDEEAKKDLYFLETRITGASQTDNEIEDEVVKP